MSKKFMSWKTKGMNRDLSVTAFNPEFAFENRNLRLSTNEFNTLLSWVNEKGTKEIGLFKDIYWYNKQTQEKLYSQPEDFNILVSRAIQVDANHWLDIETGEIVDYIPIGKVHKYRYEEVPFEEGEGGLIGFPIGTAVLNHQLIVFTTLPESGNQRQQDYIFRLTYGDVAKEKMICQMLFGKDGVSLGFSVEHPLETLVSYESESIQKIYWTDGINQPRVINIAGKINQNADAASQFDFVPELDLLEEVTVEKMLGANGMFAPGVIQYAFTYYKKNGQETNIFYTTPLHYISYRDRGASPEDKVENAFRITVTNPDTHFDYLRIYSIQRTSINGTPIVKRIQDLSLEDLKESGKIGNYISSVSKPELVVRGEVEPEEIMYHEDVQTEELGLVECYGKEQFDYMYADGRKITIKDDAPGFIWRTAEKIEYSGIDAYWVFATDTMSGGELLPLAIEGVSNLESVSFIDTGTTGDSVDPTELLYKGGEIVAVKTLEQKDGTLFLGNLSIKRPSLKDLSEDIKSCVSIESGKRQFRADLSSTGSYIYANQLTAYNGNGYSVPCGGFKTGDFYRCGIQFQHKSGRWSEPFFVDDVKVSGTPNTTDGSNFDIPVLKGSIDAGVTKGYNLLKNLKEAGYQKIRPVVVFPELKDRVTLCQGVANPTLYTENHRKNNADLYAQASWFFRPSLDKDDTGMNDNKGTATPYSYSGKNPASGQEHYSSALISIPDTTTLDWLKDINLVEIQGKYHSDDVFMLDRGTFTLNSPDIEFNEQLSNTNFNSFKYRQIGKSVFKNTMSDIDIQTETPTLSNGAKGFIHKTTTDANARGIIAGAFYNDSIVDDTEDKDFEVYKHLKYGINWHIYPWHKRGSLNNDINRPTDKGTASSILKKKVLSNLRYATTNYVEAMSESKDYLATELFSSNQVSIVKLSDGIYKGNIDTMLTSYTEYGAYGLYASDSNNWYETYGLSETSEDKGLFKRSKYSGSWTHDDNIGDKYADLVVKRDPVPMKYKSTPHLAVRLKNGDNNIHWGVKGDSSIDYYNSLPIIEIQRDPINDTTFLESLFGGREKVVDKYVPTDDALKENVWVPCGEPVRLDNLDSHDTLNFEYSYGDTYYQRWDCLKTYPFTKEDLNQIVEIGSFMLETHTNIDGRYDRNRGQINNLNMSPQNFNLLNPVYSQIDNFFSYKIMDEDYYKDTIYPNQVTWSKTKQTGADVDLWTNVTLASTMELDGDKGSINKITRLNDQLICFQDTGISQILYNENTQISTEQGVPVEIANSGKVQGKRYLSTTVGCSNKWSIVTTPAGIYFMDSNEKSIYLFNGQLNNISTAKGFNTYCKYCIPSSSVKWNPSFPKSGEKFSPFVAYYDKMNQDVLFITDNTALAFSEKLDAFTSFYDYGSASFFCNLDDTGVWIKDATLWKHQAGEYCRFFGVNKPYSTILIANQEPQVSKIYTNLEFRANVDVDMWYDEETKKYYPYLPFDSLEVWDEYQHGIGYLKNGKDVRPSSHHTLDNVSNINRKFRIWRTDVPRDNAGDEDVFDETFDRTFHIIGRLKKHPTDRMRNPWLYLRLRKAAAQDEVRENETIMNNLNRTELQDIMMTYFD